MFFSLLGRLRLSWCGSHVTTATVPALLVFNISPCRSACEGLTYMQVGYLISRGWNRPKCAACAACRFLLGFPCSRVDHHAAASLPLSVTVA